MNSKEYKQLVKIAAKLHSTYVKNHQAWEGSPFEWIKGGIPSRSKGKVGEEIVGEFLLQNGFSVSGSTGSDSDLTVNGRRMEIKLSTLWEGGFYMFQQIRQQDYDVLFCLGISPHSAHTWVTRKSDIVWSDMGHQHGGSRGNDTWWIQCYPPECSHEWMRPENGDLSKICDELRKVTQ